MNIEGEGAYRVRPSYIADKSIYELYRTKWPDLSEVESKQMMDAEKDIYAPVFRIGHQK